MRGLKYTNAFKTELDSLSHPTMGAWIEICSARLTFRLNIKSHPTMGAWIEIIHRIYNDTATMSHPTMGAWIEISR